MTDADMLLILKTDLGILSSAYDDYLAHAIETAKDLIQREGVQLTDSAEDNHLVIMYAGYLYRKRATNEGMPRMLRYALNNRIFGG